MLHRIHYAQVSKSFPFREGDSFRNVSSMFRRTTTTTTKKSILSEFQIICYTEIKVTSFSLQENNPTVEMTSLKAKVSTQLLTQ